MRKVLTAFMLVVFVAAFAFAMSRSSDKPESKMAGMNVPPMVSQKLVDLRAAMQMLWEAHVSYTRSYVTSALAGLPDADAVAARLMQNQEDIGNAIKPYYGDAAGDKLTSLLKGHIAIAAEVVTAAKEDKKDDLALAQTKWTANADDIAAFLAGANPNWPLEALKDGLHKHLSNITEQVVARLNKDWKGDIAAYDKCQMHMLHFADMLTNGIAKQFPDKFKE